MKLNVIDSIIGNTGYSKANRELFKAMEKLGFPVVHHTISPPKEGDIIYCRPFFQPTEQFFGKHKMVGQITLESTMLHEALVQLANYDYMTQVWTPSSFCRDIYVNSGVIPEKIRIIPHGVDPEIYHPTNRINDKFTFVFVGGYTGKGDRKGADMLIRAFAEEFKNDDVRLYVKINTAYGNAVNELVELAKPVKNKITFNTLNCTEDEMNQVYNVGDCYVCPSHSEGFNMTCLEAMACRLPIITTFWGGQLDYLPTSNRFIAIGGFAPARYTPWDCGRWAIPDIRSLKMEMRWSLQNQDECRKIGRKNLCVAKEWTWSEAAKKAIKALEELK
jgi:glycosyltransferase involved in cell wall biosynthesis